MAATGTQKPREAVEAATIAFFTSMETRAMPTWSEGGCKLSQTRCSFAAVAAGTASAITARAAVAVGSSAAATSEACCDTAFTSAVGSSFIWTECVFGSLCLGACCSLYFCFL